MIANVAWPIMSYQIFTAPKIRRSEFLSPIPQNQIGVFPAVNPVAPVEESPNKVQALDYTNPKNWFPQAQFASSENREIFYNLDIPSLKITDAEVIVGGEDLNKGLIHYPGTALPGQFGSPVIFGHSILRQFYNPSLDNKDRYLSIFSTIMTLKTGDLIFVDYDGVRYTYEVKDKVEVKPEDVFILQQRYNNRELKLITCVPEGTYLRRGVVIAQLVERQ